METLSIDTIVSIPTINGGLPTVAGTDICVYDLVVCHRAHMTPYYIANRFSLDLGRVYSAIAYYHLHKDQIDRDLYQYPEKEFVQQLLIKRGKTGSLIRFERPGQAFART